MTLSQETRWAYSTTFPIPYMLLPDCPYVWHTGGSIKKGWC